MWAVLPRNTSHKRKAVLHNMRRGTARRSVCFYGDAARSPKIGDNPLQVGLRGRSRHHRVGELQSHEQLALDRAAAQLEQTSARRLARAVMHRLQRQTTNLRH